MKHAERRAQLAGLAEQGLTVPQAAMAAGLSVAAIYKAATRHGLSFASAATHQLEAAYRRCCDAGMTRAETAQALGVSSGTVHRAAHAYGLKFRKRSWAKPAGVREQRMRALYKVGYTLEQISEQFGITRERVRQLLTKHYGIRAEDGGQAAKAEARRNRLNAIRDARYLEKYGCTWAQYCEIRALGREAMAATGRKCTDPRRAFTSQKQAARGRGIGWELTLAEWWAIWQASGKWAERGRGQGYVMCRRGDVGPYAPANVFIASAIENVSTRKGKKSGLPTGVQKNRRYRGYSAFRTLKGKQVRLGTFPTPELAHAAYLAAAPTHGAPHD